MGIEFDQIEGTTITRSSKGLELQRNAIVTGLSGSPDVIIYNALQEPGVPNQGDSHPSIPDLYVTNVTATPLENSNTQAWLIITYGPPNATTYVPNETNPAQIETGATIVQRQTNLDRFGDLITVTYSNPDKLDANNQPFEDTIVATVELQEPQVYLRLSRKEPEDPELKASLFVGTTNLTPFRGDGPFKWLCTAITGSSPNGGLDWDVRYEFQRNPSDWRIDVVYVDPETGNPPEDIIEGNGLVRNIEVLGLADFGALNLDV